VQACSAYDYRGCDAAKTARSFSGWVESRPRTQVAWWFETREDALLTMRVGDLILKEHREAMRLEG
jgi:hypothetical protein